MPAGRENTPCPRHNASGLHDGRLPISGNRRAQTYAAGRHWESLPLTRPSANGRLSMLVATARRVAPSKPNTVVSGSLPAKEPAPATEPQGFQFLRLSLPAGGIVVFTRKWYKPPGWGARPAGGGYIVGAWLPCPAGSSQDAPTVRIGPPMQRTASETMKHPATSRAAEPPSAGKAEARPGQSPGKRCWRSAAPSGAALTAAGGPGAHLGR